MNKSYSKIRHIQESNIRLEKRLLGEQTTSSLIGKTATLYLKDEDSKNAFNKNQNNPSAEGARKIKIESIEPNQSGEGISLMVSLWDVPTQEYYPGRYSLEYNRNDGAFYLQQNETKYYSESIKNILEKEYYSFKTDLAKTDKNSSSVA
jgi:hypothetical protein